MIHIPEQQKHPSGQPPPTAPSDVAELRDSIVSLETKIEGLALQLRLLNHWLYEHFVSDESTSL